jgi:hypothetical protein
MHIARAAPHQKLGLGQAPAPLVSSAPGRDLGSSSRVTYQDRGGDLQGQGYFLIPVPLHL